ncbi:S8 family serine peptidase [Siccirubricoccus sp. G192]|uniref:S8 family serine peptidase n=1 Tax=Siccirubricoccus sp. G192 TaxID=2849651 RepID=UPI001C2BE2D7|nr:S8 family serine peptidase [Siccirubricoccus sp. G192]MBV1797142.1 S8 family serine peptidase [Siccirubricoccus sp. G192]
MPCSCHSDSAEHPLNWRIWRHDQSGFDVVFAAGNCGGFCPKSRCGPDDRGPGRSVHGPNARPEVLTVGAVRVDGTWLGYSSQGPGPRPEPPEQAGYASPSQDHPPQGPEAARLAHDKPDLCAPSQFADDEDAAGANTGTSAACGIAAGAVAALRSGWSPCDLPPAMLRECLRRQARRPAGAAWNNRLGWGILDLGATLAEITRRME